jgi:hypothetical protein
MVVVIVGDTLYNYFLSIKVLAEIQKNSQMNKDNTV